MSKRCLILGYGRAGKRHAEYAKQFGYEVFTADPGLHAEVNYRNVAEAMNAESWDAVVIASPPNWHLDQLDWCARLDIPMVLCEKPLCDLGQLPTLYGMHLPEFTMVAYNWLWHGQVNATQAELKHFLYTEEPLSVFLTSYQYRAQLPTWSLLLDHVSHDLSILYHLLGLQPANEVLGVTLTGVEQDVDFADIREVWHLDGRWTNSTPNGVVGLDFGISDGVYKEQKARTTQLSVWGRQSGNLIDYPLVPTEKMFQDMWEDFYRGNDTKSSLYVARKVQHLLEQANSIAVHL